MIFNLFLEHLNNERLNKIQILDFQHNVTFIKIFCLIYPEIQKYFFLNNSNLNYQHKLFDKQFLYDSIPNENYYKEFFFEIYPTLCSLGLNFNLNKNLINMISSYSNSKEGDFFEHFDLKRMNTINKNHIPNSTMFISYSSSYFYSVTIENILGSILKCSLFNFKKNVMYAFFEIDFLLDDCIAVESCGSPHTTNLIIGDNFEFDDILSNFPFQILNFDRNSNLLDNYSVDQLEKYKHKLQRMKNKFEIYFDNFDQYFIENLIPLEYLISLNSK